MSETRLQRAFDWLTAVTWEGNGSVWFADTENGNIGVFVGDNPMSIGAGDEVFEAVLRAIERDPRALERINFVRENRGDDPEPRRTNSTMNAKPDLLPCPFCGGPAKLHCAEDAHTGNALFSGGCETCGFGLRWADSSDEATDEWNTRAIHRGEQIA